MANTAARTYKPAPRRRSRRPLPRLGWWWLAVIVTAIAIARTWPYWTGGIAALAAAVLITCAIRPRRLNRLWNALDTATDRRRITASGHGRTLKRFLRMDPTQFEHAVAGLLNQRPDVAGTEVHGGSGDRGVDVLATLHDGRRILIQCKRYQIGTNVGGPIIRETLGSVTAARCHHGVIITTSSYTREALDTNSTLGPNMLTLVDGEDLAALARGHYLRLW